MTSENDQIKCYHYEIKSWNYDMLNYEKIKNDWIKHILR